MKKSFTITSSLLALAAVSATAVLAQEAPSLTVITPSEGQTIYGPRIPILISAENFDIVDYSENQTVSTGQGHIHLWLDDPNPTAESAVKLSDNIFTYSDVSYGDHTLRTELVNNNHTSLQPPIVTTINFKSAPAATPAPAQAASFDKNTAFVILIVVSIVIAAAWWYTKEEDEKPKASQTKKVQPKKKTTKRRKSKK